MLKHVENHLRIMIDFGTDRYGHVHTPLLMATLDPLTRRYPDNDTREGNGTERAYRLIHAPRGSSAYWDQPTFKAMYSLSRLTGKGDYAEAADRAQAFFMERCKADNGIFYWGNHYFYDVFDDVNVEFATATSSGKSPVRTELPPEVHEMRPIAPNWEDLYRINPQAVERHIRQSAADHLYDAEVGGFNRHSDRKKDCAFLEAGGILSEAFCFLAARSQDETLADTALRVAEFSFSHRDSRTGLLVNNPGKRRWDGQMATTECGHWALSLLKGAAGIQDAWPEKARRLREKAQSAVEAYLSYGYDEASGLYYGKLYMDGSPAFETETRYQPGDYSDIWTFLFPSHDYPMHLAMTALSLSDSRLCQEAAERWFRIVAADSGRQEVRVRYAEQYARNIAFLIRYYKASGEALALNTARELAERAVGEYLVRDMFIGHTGAKWYDAIDGVGYLLSALMYLETMDEAVIEHF